VSRALRALFLAATLAAFVSAEARSAAGPSSAPPTGNSAASETLQEVTVTAERLKKLARRVSKFVNQIADLENAGGLPVWKEPVCPLVSGLSRQDGEFILERVSDIASAARVPLAHEHCRPNFFVIVTADPRAFLEKMDNRTRLLAFGGVAPRVIDEFIATPRAVRVWYGSTEVDAWGMPLTGCQGVSINGLPTGCGEGSHLVFNVIWKFSRVFVIADRARLHGVTRGQLADYVAMVGLAKLKPGAHLGDAPTILKLFEGAPQAAPAGMTDWDQTFLESLYATEQRSILQRSQIARAMLREIGH